MAVGCHPAFRAPKVGGTWICFVLCSPRGQGQGQQIRQGAKEDLPTSREQWEWGGRGGGGAAVRKAVGKGHTAETWRIPAPIGGRRSRPRVSAQKPRASVRGLGKRWVGRMQRPLGICRAGMEGSQSHKRLGPQRLQGRRSRRSMSA